MILYVLLLEREEDQNIDNHQEINVVSRKNKFLTPTKFYYDKPRRTHITLENLDCNGYPKTREREKDPTHYFVLLQFIFPTVNESEQETNRPIGSL